MGNYSLIAIWAASLCLITVGLAGTVFPALPGSPLIFAGVFLLAWWQDFQTIGWVPLLILGLLSVVSMTVDIISSALGAKRAGASSYAIWGSFIGSIIGIFFGIPGLLVGPFLGAFAGEMIAQRNMPRAAHVGFATWLGMLVGTVIKVGIAASMLGVFLFALLW